MVYHLIKLNKFHVWNFDIVSDMIEKIFPDICQSFDVTKKTIKKVNDYNASLHLKVVCTLDDIKTKVEYFGHAKEDSF